ncbi:MAG: putative metal-binding motif-containing protein, partial [Myxococcota bacterium]
VMAGWWWVGLGCADPAPGESGQPRCDGLLQASEGTVDAPFDRDGDGFVDGSHPECVATFAEWVLDCDDLDPDRAPGRSEIGCNATDDDCNPDTPDSLDRDQDGALGCSDCDDHDAGRSPELADRCWDDIDNDCDGVVDQGCGPDYNGSFTLDRAVQYQCLDGVVQVNFDALTVFWIPPYASLLSEGSPMPGTVSGLIQEDGTFQMSGSTSIGTGVCDATWTFVGAFDDVDHFTTDFQLRIEGFLCNSCPSESWPNLAAARTTD